MNARQQAMSWESEDYPLPTIPASVPPPHLLGPLYECGRAVAVRGVVEGAQVSVYDRSSDALLGTATATSGSVQVDLSGPLLLGHTVYARQTVNNITSFESNVQAVISFNGPLPTPRLNEGIWECGRGVEVAGSVPGAMMNLNRYIGPTSQGFYEQRAASSERVFIRKDIPSAHTNHELTAYQYLCPTTPSSPESSPKVIAPAPNPMPVPEILAATVGSRLVTVGKVLSAGANLIFSNQGVVTDGTLSLRSRQSVQLANPVPANASLTVAQELCDVSSPSVPFIPASQTELLQLLGTPEVMAPVCPGSTYVAVKTSLPEGYVVLDTDTSSQNGYVALASATAGETLVGIPGGVTNGMQLHARQVLQTTQSPYSAGVTAGFTSRLTAEGAETFTDQDTGMPVSGFVRETSRGPRFVLHECCDGSAARPAKLTAQVRDSAGRSYATVTLHKQFEGRYEGQWDWFIPRTDPRNPVPPILGDYTLRVTTPCSMQVEDLPFKVFRSQPEVGDTTLPSFAELGINVGGTTTKVTTTGATVDIVPGTSYQLTAQARDQEGLKSLQIIASPTMLANSIKVAQAQTPIPGVLNHTATLPGLLPTQEVTVIARGSNYASPSGILETGVLTLRAVQLAPSIDSVTPSPTYMSDGEGTSLKVTINGNRLFYPNLTTTITFEAADGSMHTATSFNQSTSTDEKLRDVVLPAGLIGKSGEVKVRVQVGTLTSDAFIFTSLDRPTGFNRIKLGDLWQPVLNQDLTTFECKDNGQTITQATHPNAVKYVEIGRNLANAPFTHTARFKRVDGTYTNGTEIEFSVHPDNNIGGVRMMSDCRLAVVLNYTDGGYNAVFSYFRRDGSDFRYTNYGQASPYYGDRTSPPTGTGREWNVFVSKDGSVAVVTHSSELDGPAGANIPTVASIIDFRFLDPDLRRWNQSGSCASNALCDFGATLTQGRNVNVSLDGASSFLNQILPD